MPRPRSGGHLPRHVAFQPVKVPAHPDWDRTPRTEKAEEAATDRLMRDLGFNEVRFSQARASNQTRGIADRFYGHPGRKLGVWFEAKRPDGKGEWSPDQQAFCELMRATGGNYVVGSRWNMLDWLREQGFAFAPGSAAPSRPAQGT